MNDISKIREEIDHIKEYLATDLCRKCQEMLDRLAYCDNLLSTLSNNEKNNNY